MYQYYNRYKILLFHYFIVFLMEENNLHINIGHATKYTQLPNESGKTFRLYR